jgi:hypothetical protein
VRASASCASGGRPRNTWTARSKSSVTNSHIPLSGGNLNGLPRALARCSRPPRPDHPAGAVPLNPVASR